MSESWAVDTIAVGPVAAGTIAWRRGGQLWATVVAKMTFPWSPGGVLTPGAPDPILRGERHHGDSPGRSIRAASDLCPFLELADVVFVGSAHAPRGQDALMVKVRLAIVRGSWFVLDKGILVYGDQGAQGPKPFKKMPIVFERSFGGAGNLDNPLGVATPNILYEDPGHERAAAALAPLSWYWPARKRGLKAFSRAILDSTIPELPEDVDIECFQAAPEDQRIPFLRGEELIMLNGVHPDHTEIMMRLPALRGLARAYTGEGVGATVALHADTLLIDGDAERCSITCRGNFSVADEAMLERLCVAATIEMNNNPVEWPDLVAVRRIMAREAAKAAPSAAASGARTSPASADKGWNERTVELRSEVTLTLKPATPFLPKSEAPTERFKVFEPPVSDGGTVRLKSSDLLAQTIAAPYAIAAASSEPVLSSSLPLPGAPWAARSAPPTPPPRRAVPLREETIPDVDDAFVVAPPAAPAHVAPPPLVTSPEPPKPEPIQKIVEPPPAPKPSSPGADAPHAKPAWSWAPSPKPPDAPSAPTPAAAKPPPPPAVKNKLYGSFGPQKK